jgi:hypothetical protein
MARYSPDEIRDLAARFGSIAKAEEKAREVPGFGEEIRRVEDGLDWLSTFVSEPAGRRDELMEERCRLVVEALADGPRDVAAPKSHRGRRKSAVSVLEANQAAAIYVENPVEYDAREDDGAYAVHTLYTEDRDLGPLLLSRPMVGHLIRAVREGWLPWDAEKGQLRISDEFRTSRGMFTIPRSKPGS